MNTNLTFDGNDEGPFARLVLIHPNGVPRRLEVLLDPGRACLERASALARLDDYLLLGACCCCCLFRRGLPGTSSSAAAFLFPAMILLSRVEPG